MTYKFVTREEWEAFKSDQTHDLAEAIEYGERLLAERDVFWKIAIECNENSADHIYGDKWLEDVGAEAARLMEGKK